MGTLAPAEVKGDLLFLLSQASHVLMTEMTAALAALGEFLKTRRANLSPADVGLPPGFRRRTAGLRREEVALLAGVGVTWYTWLEQGRPINASAQVLDAVARTLRMDHPEREHLYRLAELTPSRPPWSAEVVPDAVRWRSRKSSLSPAFTHTVLSFDRHRLDEVVFGDPSVVEPYVNVKRLQQTWRRGLRTANTDDVFPVWRVASLALWLRRREVTI